MRTFLPVVLIVFVLVTVSGLFIYSSRFGKPVILEDSLPTRILPTLEVTDLPVLQWNTFNPAYSVYMFEYPQEYVLAEAENGGQLETPDKNSIQFISQKETSPTIADYLVKADEVSRTAWEGKPSLVVESSKKTVIGEYSVIQRKETLLAADAARLVTYFKKGNTLVSLSLIVPAGNSGSQDEKIYNQMVRTFRFK